MWTFVLFVVVLLAATLFRPLSAGLFRAAMMLLASSRLRHKELRAELAEHKAPPAPLNEQTTN